MVAMELRLKQMLEKRGCSIYWLSQVTKTRYATLHDWTQRTPQAINLETLEKVCRALECEPADLLVMSKPKDKKVTLKVTKGGRKK